MRFLVCFFGLLFPFLSLHSQMAVNGDTLVGNEWIKYDQQYIKIKVAEDGVFRVYGQELASSGLDLNSNTSDHLQLWHNGKDVYIHTSTNQIMSPSDYIEFYGEKNRLALDTFLYKNWQEDLLNPEYSLLSDTSVYYLTWGDNNTQKRYETISPDYGNNTLIPEKYFIHQQVEEFHNSYFKPTYNGSDNVKLSNFVPSEGFSKGLARNSTISVPSDHVYRDEELFCSLEIRTGSNGIFQNIRNYQWNNIDLERDTTGEYEVVQKSFVVSNSTLESLNQFKITNNGDSDRHSLSVVALSYPHTFDVSDLSNQFSIDVDSGDRYFQISNLDINDQEIVYDIKNGKRYVLNPQSDFHELIVKGNVSKELFFFSTHKNQASLSSFTFEDIRNWNLSYLLLTSNKLYQTQGAERDALKDYEDYRNSVDGGGFTAKVVDVNMIYDHFGYGIPNHLHAFKNFSFWAKKNWPLEYVNILGKGREYHSVRTNEQIDSPINSTFFVPSYGDSPSDYLLFSFEDRPNPYFAIGRVAAKSMAEVGNYLDKLKVHDSAIKAPQEKDKLWLKNVLHLGGGGKESEKSTIQDFLVQMGDDLKFNQFGANIIEVFKSSSATIQEADIQLIENSINNGVAMINFFGHASVGTWDFSLKEAASYDNIGKLPFIFALGCYSGNICSSNSGVSEDWVLIEDKGAIGYIASSGSAYLNTQGNYGKSFYASLGEEFYNESLGNMFKTINERNKDDNNLSRLSLYQQFGLHGDPAVRIHGFDAPDYTVDYNSISLNPKIVELTSQQFDFSFDILNIGRAIEDSLDIKLIHILPSADTALVVKKRIPSPKYSDNLSITIPIEGKNVLGTNRIEVYLDEENKIEELSEANNRLANFGKNGFEFDIIDNGVRPLFPRNFSIVNQQNFDFLVGTGNAFGQEIAFDFEIDTTELFNSPILFKSSSSVKNGIAKIANPLQSLTDETVYYWRIKNTNSSTDSLWTNRSFVYLSNGEEGWNQSHYFQHLKNDQSSAYVDNQRSFQFEPQTRNIKIVNGIWQLDVTGYQVDLSTFSVSVRPWNYMSEGIAIAVLDTINGSHIVNSGGDHGSILSSNIGAKRSFGFLTNSPEERQKVVNFIENVVPDGYYVSVFTILKTEDAELNTDEWRQDEDIYEHSIFSILEKHGATFTDELEERGNVPYTFMFRKNKYVIGEDVGEDKFSLTSTNMAFPYRGSTGVFVTEPITGVSSWEKVDYDFNVFDENDTISVDVLAMLDNNTDSLLISSVLPGQDISSINPLEFDKIRLRLNMSDVTDKTAPQLNFWRTSFSPLPDAYIQVGEIKDSIQQGENLSFVIKAINYTQQDMDSLLVSYSLTDQQNLKTEVTTRLAPLLHNDSLMYSAVIPTKNLLGNYIVDLKINPFEDQRELTFNNNTASRQITVYPDRTNPVFDVTFDGIHIMNGDIVAPKPEITITVSDENPYLLLENLESFEYELRDLDNNLFINLTEEMIDFSPAINLENNTSILRLYPNLKTGNYSLKVNTSDESNNVSGDYDYIIEFEVVERQTISNVLNYPNPFSTSTQFVFTITGNVPNDMAIQIFTVSGKLVKQISMAELGRLRVGHNITSYSWDGRDEYGAKLANGVYFYKVIAKNENQEDIERFSSGADSFFKKGFSKMVILR